MTKKEMIYDTFIDLFQWMDASEVEELDSKLSEDVALHLKFAKQRPTKPNIKSAIREILLSKISLAKAEERLPSDGLLSIQADMIADKWISVANLLKFIRKWKKEGLFEFVDMKWELRNLRTMKVNGESTMRKKIYLVEKIVRECSQIKNVELRIDLQRHFGQFDGAQICEHCGNIMWDGYSWEGTTYCDDACVMAGEGIDRKQFNKDLEDAEDPDWPCYWTSWV